MTLSRLVARNLAYYWRTNLAVLAGVGAAVAVFSGAMLVGESVRSSLRDLILERLGSADYALSADRMFREDLANRIASNPEFQRDFKAVCPIVLLQGALIHEKSGLRAHSALLSISAAGPISCRGGTCDTSLPSRPVIQCTGASK